MLVFIHSVYFSSGFGNDILNQCHALIRVLLIMLSFWGFAHDKACILGTDAQPYMCGFDSLQTLGQEVWCFSPVWLTLGMCERQSRHCWGSCTNTNKSLLENGNLQMTF